jgi:hypothetical protein
MILMFAIRLYTSAARRFPSRQRHSITHAQRLFSVSPSRMATAESPLITPETMEAINNSPTFQKISKSPAALAALFKVAEELQKSGS